MKRIFAIVLTFALTLCTLAALTSCGGAKFDENKNISVVTREDGSGTKSAFMEIIGLKGKSDVSGVIIGSSTAAVLNEVKSNPFAIGYDSLGYITDDVKMLKVDGVCHANPLELTLKGLAALAFLLFLLCKTGALLVKP